MSLGTSTDTMQNNVTSAAIQTQQVADACKDFHQDSLKTHMLKADHITIGSKDGKKETPREIYLETNKLETIKTLKDYGILKGTTPTAIAIAKLGEYRRKLKAQENYGVQSVYATQKDTICQTAQARLKELESKELTIDFTDDTARRAFIQEIKDILNKAINENKTDCDSLFHREGRLEKHLIQAVNYLEEDFDRAFLQRAPEVSGQATTVGAYFSREDQLYFDEMDGIKSYPIHLTKDAKDNEVLDFLAFQYEKANKGNLKATNNQLYLSGILGQSKQSVFLSQKRSFLRKLYHSSKFIGTALLSFIKQPFEDVGLYLKSQGSILLDNVFTPFARVEATSAPLIGAEADSFTELAQESSTDPTPAEIIPTEIQKSDSAVLTDSAWLTPKHQVRLKDQYDDLFSQALYLVRNTLKPFDTLSKSHEVIALGVSAAGIASLLVLFNSGLIHGSLKSIINSFFHANKIGPAEKIISTLSNMRNFSRVMVLPNLSVQEIIDSYGEELSDPLRLIGCVTAYMALLTNITGITNPQLDQKSIALVRKTVANIRDAFLYHSKINTQPQRAFEPQEKRFLQQIENEIKKQTHYLNQKRPPASMLGAALLLPLKPIFAVLKPLVALSAASIASLRFKNWAPLQIAWKESVENFKADAKHLALMAVDFTDTLLKSVYDIAAFAIRTPIKAAFTIVRKIIGTANDLTAGVLNTPLKSITKGLVNAEHFIVNRLGGRLRHLFRDRLIGDSFKPLRNTLHPNSPIERLIVITKTLESCNDYFQYQLDFIKRHTNEAEPELTKLMQRKIEEISALTKDMLSLCATYKEILILLIKENKETDPTQVDALIKLKKTLHTRLKDFDSNMTLIDQEIENTHPLADKDLTIAVRFNQQREALHKVVKELPDQPSAIPHIKPHKHP